ncbi:YdcF family protein [Devosia sp.]|uniref:YdcF family protein n=1 Tax=Devosia sp. TaxID=1871048 RepID=UPI002AFFF3EB|nr:YdcF family protein [Devosia sp.]
MFFLVSKIFWLLAQPLSIAVLLVLLAIAALVAGRRRLGMAACVSGLLVLVLSSFTSLGFLLIRPLEERFPRPSEMPAGVDAIVVLGGSSLSRVSAARGISELNDAADRLTDAVILARRYPQARVVFSGGSGLLEAAGETEAATAGRFLLAMGIAPERLVLEDQARNTDENAGLTAALLGADTGAVVLVTSAFHMPRSVGLFRQAGIEVIAWPTDYRSAGTEGFGPDLANPIHNLNTTSIAIKEWIGLAAYHWTGRTGEIFPGP